LVFTHVGLKIGEKKISDYIKEIEAKPLVTAETEGAATATEDKNAVKTTPISIVDIKEHINNHLELMPRISGPKAHALAAPLVRDESDIPDNNSLNVSSSSNPAVQKSNQGIQPMITFTKPHIFP